MSDRKPHSKSEMRRLEVQQPPKPAPQEWLYVGTYHTDTAILVGPDMGNEKFMLVSKSELEAERAKVAELERELELTLHASRAEAQQADQLREQLTAAKTAYEELYEITREQMNVDSVERARLREENAQFRNAVDALTHGYPSEWVYTILKKERDELRTEIEHWKAEASNIDWQRNLAVRERDEARAEVDKRTNDIVKLTDQTLTLTSTVQKLKHDALGIDNEADYQKEIERLKLLTERQAAQIEFIKGNAELGCVLENDDCYYWTRSAWNEFQQLKLTTENYRAKLAKLADTIDESLLLDESLADDWAVLRGAVIEARKALEKK